MDVCSNVDPQKVVYPSQVNPITTKNALFPSSDFYLIVLLIYIIFCASSPLNNRRPLGSHLIHLIPLFQCSPKYFMVLPWVPPFHCYDVKIQYYGPFQHTYFEIIENSLVLTIWPTHLVIFDISLLLYTNQGINVCSSNLKQKILILGRMVCINNPSYCLLFGKNLMCILPRRLHRYCGP